MDRAPHPLAMPPPDKVPKDAAADREAKLAQALRANLRRRKTSAALKGASGVEQKSEKDG